MTVDKHDLRLSLAGLDSLTEHHAAVLEEAHDDFKDAMNALRAEGWSSSDFDAVRKGARSLATASNKMHQIALLAFTFLDRLDYGMVSNDD